MRAYGMKLLMIGLMSLFMNAVGRAGVLYVLSSEDYPTIASALAEVFSGDRIVVAAGWYDTRSRAVRRNGRNEAGEPVGSGVYWVVMKTDEGRWVRKVVVGK